MRWLWVAHRLGERTVIASVNGIPMADGLCEKPPVRLGVAGIVALGERHHAVRVFAAESFTASGNGTVGDALIVRSISVRAFATLITCHIGHATLFKLVSVGRTCGIACVLTPAQTDEAGHEESGDKAWLCAIHRTSIEMFGRVARTESGDQAFLEERSVLYDRFVVFRAVEVGLGLCMTARPRISCRRIVFALKQLHHCEEPRRCDDCDWGENGLHRNGAHGKGEGSSDERVDA